MFTANSACLANLLFHQTVSKELFAIWQKISGAFRVNALLRLSQHMGIGVGLGSKGEHHIKT